jgi:hypothetical protein
MAVETSKARLENFGPCNRSPMGSGAPSDTGGLAAPKKQRHKAESLASAVLSGSGWDPEQGQAIDEAGGAGVRAGLPRPVLCGLLRVAGRSAVVTVMSIVWPIMILGARIPRARRSSRARAVTVADRLFLDTSASPARRTLLFCMVRCPVTCQPAGEAVMVSAANVMTG